MSAIFRGSVPHPPVLLKDSLCRTTGPTFTAPMARRHLIGHTTVQAITLGLPSFSLAPCFGESLKGNLSTPPHHSKNYCGAIVCAQWKRIPSAVCFLVLVGLHLTWHQPTKEGSVLSPQSQVSTWACPLIFKVGLVKSTLSAWLASKKPPSECQRLPVHEKAPNRIACHRAWPWRHSRGFRGAGAAVGI